MIKPRPRNVCFVFYPDFKWPVSLVIFTELLGTGTSAPGQEGWMSPWEQYNQSDSLSPEEPRLRQLRSPIKRLLCRERGWSLHCGAKKTSRLPRMIETQAARWAAHLAARFQMRRREDGPTEGPDCLEDQVLGRAAKARGQTLNISLQSPGHPFLQTPAAPRLTERPPLRWYLLQLGGASHSRTTPPLELQRRKSPTVRHFPEMFKPSNVILKKGLDFFLFVCSPEGCSFDAAAQWRGGRGEARCRGRTPDGAAAGPPAGGGAPQQRPHPPAAKGTETFWCWVWTPLGLGDISIL